jgi:hypothetical protein
MNSHSLIIPPALIDAAIAGRITKWISLVPEPHQSLLNNDDYLVDEFLPDQHSPLGVPGDEIYMAEELRGDGQPGNRRVGIMRYGFDGEMVLACATCGKVKCKHSNFLADVVWQYTTNSRSAKQMPRWASRRVWRNTGVEVKQWGGFTAEEQRLYLQIHPGIQQIANDDWYFVTSLEAM